MPSCLGGVVGKQIKPNPLARESVSPDYLDGINGESADTETLIGPKRTQIGFRGSLYTIQMNGGDDGTRTRDLCRDRAAF
jgi:hypothetical protein